MVKNDIEEINKLKKLIEDYSIKLKNQSENKGKKSIKDKIWDDIRYKKKVNELVEKHKKYLDILKKKREDNLKQLKIKDKKVELSIHKEIIGLKKTSEIKIQQFISDKSFLRRIDKIKWYQLIKKIKRRLKKQVLVVMHRPDNYDIARFFSLEKNHIINIDDHRYLFNPEHFRYINGMPILYFYWGNPFAKIINIKEGYTEPTISAEAFTSVLNSKFVIDAVKGEQVKIGFIWNIIIILILLVVLIATFINIVGIQQISKTLGA